MQKICPCHSGNTYQNCCARFHAGASAPNAEQLMRSRYSAYAFKLTNYLRDTWHSSTRPNDLTPESLLGIKWLKLMIVSTQPLDANHATVTFKATFKVGQQKNQTLHETSRFVLENGEWFYVDGDIHSE